MGYNVGLPILKCSLNPSQTVYTKKTATGSIRVKSNTASLGGVWHEMNDDRIGKDEEIDKDLTHNNVWLEGSSEDDVPSMVQKEIDRINDIRHENGKKSLRKDAVCCITIVEKPPMEYMQTLSRDEQIKFLKDSHEAIKNIILQRYPDWKFLETVSHFDEHNGLSPHNHSLILVESTEQVGDKMIPTMRAKTEVNKKFYSAINKEYPAAMRRLGYDVSDCKMYEDMTDEQKEEAKKNRKVSLDAVTYKRMKDKEVKEMEQNIESKKAEMQSLDSAIHEKKEALGSIEQQQSKLDSAVKEHADARQTYIEKAAETEKEKERLQEKIVAVTESPNIKKYADVLKENKQLRSDISLKDKLIESLQKENVKLKAAVQHWQKTAERWKQTVISIAEKAGSKLMKAFGYDLSESGISEYPTADVSSAIYKMKSEIDEIDPKSLAAIPDSDRKGKYRLAARDENGHYKTVKSGFATRDDAIAYRQNYKSAAKALHSKQLDHSHSREAKM